jgi:phosphoribosyl-AMP cyclohydrolase
MRGGGVAPRRLRPAGASRPRAPKTFSCLPTRSVLIFGAHLKTIMSFYDKLKFDANGLIPAIVQEQKTGRVLMMAWMNRASLEQSLATGKTHFWSRSRQKFWMKGESSGHTQTIKDIAFDCDGDTLLIQVEQIGAACHEGYRSCFFRSVREQGARFDITEPQLETPEQIYGRK